VAELETDIPETEGFLTLYDETVAVVYAYCRKRAPELDAQDVTSEVFLAALRWFQDGRADEVTPAWLLLTAKHRLIDRWRRADYRRSRRVLLDERRADTASMREQVRLVLAELPEHYRNALALRYLDDFTVAETAAALGRSVPSTESLLARARLHFRHTFAELV
jgi:RNA polymerase sigma-70 factor, ECF subfamily